MSAHLCCGIATAVDEQLTLTDGGPGVHFSWAGCGAIVIQMGPRPAPPHHVEDLTASLPAAQRSGDCGAKQPPLVSGHAAATTGFRGRREAEARQGKVTEQRCRRSTGPPKCPSGQRHQRSPDSMYTPSPFCTIPFHHTRKGGDGREKDKVCSAPGCGRSRRLHNGNGGQEA